MSWILLKLKARLPWETFACHQLGALYAQGDGVGVDLAAAQCWYRLGAQRGDAESQYDLGFMQLHGEGAPADVPQALGWLRQAATAGHADAARLLAQIARDGLFGQPQDAHTAQAWTGRALELGCPVEMLEQA